MYAVQSAYIYYFGRTIIMSGESQENVKQNEMLPSS